MSSTRTPRRSTSGSLSAMAAAADNPADKAATKRRAESTPGKKSSKPKKRVRFSDPGPSHDGGDDELHSTGLTPLVGRTSMATDGAPRRRHSTSGNGMWPPTPFSGEVRVLPLCQVLDGRVKRRIRRNGLSEEMNTIHAEKSRRARETKGEVDRLKAALAEKDEALARLDGERVMELEREVSALKSQLAETGRGERSSPSSPSYDWTMAARGPFADDYTDLDHGREMHDVEGDMDDDDDVFGDATMAELACSTPSRRAPASASASFPTPPPTSPAAVTPSSKRPGAHFCTPTSDAAVQVFFPDPEKEELEVELASLKLEIRKLTATLEDYSGLEKRLSDKLCPLPTGDDVAAQHPLEARLQTLLQSLSDRTAALHLLTESLGDLGFPGADASDMIASLRTSLRTARLELEYLTPGEIELPLTSAGAAVLELLLTRLRHLGSRVSAADAEIDEYHALEQNLRAQLGARADAMDTMAASLRQKDAAVAKRDDRIVELEVGADRLKGALRTYARDVRELEALVQKLDAQLSDAVAGREATEAELAERAAELSTALARAAKLADEVAELKTRHAEDLAATNREHGRALALRDARIAELRKEMDRVNCALRDAHDALQRLRVEKTALETRSAADRVQAKSVVDAMKVELERVVKMTNGFLEGTPDKTTAGQNAGSLGAGHGANEGPKRGGFLSAELAKRRRHDSGLGFLEDEVDLVGVSTG